MDGPVDDGVRTWPLVGPVRSERLRLDPLRVGDSEQLLPVLADASLYHYTGGAPPTLQQLRERLMNQVYGRSPDGDEGWFNWVLRLRDGGQIVGTVQATAVDRAFAEVELAWILGTAHQGHGYATEAVVALRDWLAGFDARELCAYIHPDNVASAGVARRAGLVPSSDTRYDEVRWVMSVAPPPDVGAPS